MRTIMLATLLLFGAAPLAVQAAPRQLSQQQLQQVELSLMLKGTLQIDAQGRVTEFILQPNRHATESAMGFVRGQVASWEFEPYLVDNQPTAFSSEVTLRLVGRPTEDGGMNVRIASAHFDAGDRGKANEISRKSLSAPQYPRELYNRGMAGIVYLMLNVNAKGEVADVAVEQVNLTRIGNERQMRQARDGLGRSAMQAARSWTFNVPAAGPDTGKDSWHVRVPVNYSISDSLGSRAKDSARGWEAYIPGPRLPVAWRQASAEDGYAGLDALADGQLQLVDGGGPRLKTPLQG